jgi:hypothetical protein
MMNTNGIGWYRFNCHFKDDSGRIHRYSQHNIDFFNWCCTKEREIFKFTVDERAYSIIVVDDDTYFQQNIESGSTRPVFRFRNSDLCCNAIWFWNVDEKTY